MSIAFRWKARYTVLSILFVTWVVSFMDRTVINVALPYIAKDFGLTPFRMGVVLSVFFGTYAIAQIPGGLLSDKYGSRKVGTFAMVWWTAFTAITGLTRNLTQMLASRILFGLGEGIFPASAYKTIAVWFPQKERATAKGIAFASNPLGIAIAPIIVVWIMARWGWRPCFYILCIPGILISILWWVFVTDQPSKNRRVSPQERIEIEGEKTLEVAEAKVSYWSMFKDPYVLSLFAINMTFNIALWGFNSWLPTYLVKVRGFSMAQMGIAASMPFFAGALGTALGGWVSDRFFPTRRRVLIVAIQLMSALFLYLTLISNTMMMFIICQTLAGAFIQTHVSALWALPYNNIPKKVFGTASAVINLGSYGAALLSPLAIGYLLGISGGNFHSTFIFLIGSILVSSTIVTFVLPKRANTTIRPTSPGPSSPLAAQG